MSKKILITGGSGTVSEALTNHLLNKGYEVSHLSRSPGKNSKVKTYLWDVAKKQIDENCIDDIDTIIHLAGAGIADKNWSEERKQLLIKSRTDSIGLIYDLMRKKAHQIKTVISASASGYYSDRGDEILTEQSQPEKDFLGECCVLWEQAVDVAKEFNARIVKFRTGVILDKSSGALPKIAQPIKLGLGAPLGTGKQWISWIHLDDVVKMYVYALEHEELEGVFNMSAPHPLTNQQLTKAIATQLHKPLILPHVPAFVLKVLFGEMSLVVLGSTRMNVQKIIDSGYEFIFSDIEPALKDIYG